MNRIHAAALVFGRRGSRVWSRSRRADDEIVGTVGRRWLGLLCRRPSCRIWGPLDRRDQAATSRWG